MNDSVIVSSSDLHRVGAAACVINYLHAQFPGAWYVHQGDRTIDPDFSSTGGENLLKTAKREAKQRGLSVVDSERRVFEGKHGMLVAEQWAGIVEPTRDMHTFFEYEFLNQRLPPIFDTEGNDYDKYRRVERAQHMLGRQNEQSLTTIVEGSVAFDRVSAVKIDYICPTLTFFLPYTEDTTEDMRDHHLQSIELQLDTKKSEPIEQIVLRSHQNPDPVLRSERHNGWFMRVYDLLKNQCPNAEIVHIFGHCHQIPDPYEYHGAVLVPAGYGEEQGLQRVVYMDSANPRRRGFADLRINPDGYVIKEAEGAF